MQVKVAFERQHSRVTYVRVTVGKYSTVCNSAYLDMALVQLKHLQNKRAA